MRRRQSRPRFCGGCLHGRAEANATDVRCPDDGRVRTRGAWRSRGADPLNNAAYSIRSARRGRQGRARSAEARPRMAGRRSALDDAAVTCRRRPRCRSRCRRRCATHADASFPAGPTDEPACRRAARFATQTGTSRAESSSMISPRTRSRKHRSPHRKWPVRSTRRSTPTASDAHSTRAPTTVSVCAGPRWTPRCGHAAADLGARGEAHRARRSVSEGGRERWTRSRVASMSNDLPARLRDSDSFDVRRHRARARRARSPQRQRQRPRRADERRAARCGGDPSRREMHGMRMGRL